MDLKRWFQTISLQGSNEDRHREQTYGQGERGGESEMYGESNIETYINICKIDSQWEFPVCLRELKQGLCINLEGWNGREMGGGSEGRGYMYTYTLATSCEELTHWKRL